MKVIVDTNVPIVANQQSSQASPDCVIACVRRLRQVQERDILVLDDGWHILREYMANLRSSGQPGVGDAFLKWVLTHQANPRHCEQVTITVSDEGGFAEFPNDASLASFDRSDHKFVAVAMSHPERPPILNAVDRDWWHYKQALERHGIIVEHLCPDTMALE